MPGTFGLRVWWSAFVFACGPLMISFDVCWKGGGGAADLAQLLVELVWHLSCMVVLDLALFLDRIFWAYSLSTGF